MNSGKCEGGPLDGKSLHHPEKTFKVAHRNGKFTTWFGPPVEDIKVGEYRFKAGKWVWKEK